MSMREKPLTTTKTSGSHFRKARWRVSLALNKWEKETALLLRQRVREVAHWEIPKGKDYSKQKVDTSDSRHKTVPLNEVSGSPDRGQNAKSLRKVS